MTFRIWYLIISLFLLGLGFSSCDKNPKSNVNFDNQEFSDYLFSLRKNEDSLQKILSQNIANNNPPATMLTYKQLGNYYRENSNFIEAINYHKKGYKVASGLVDTVEMVQALNNLGTDFRRIGALIEASDYHYQAFRLAESYSDINTEIGTKNLVISLNGIGNVSFSLGQHEEAKAFFKQALEGEKFLNSYIGQAINYANIGSIYQEEGKYDSAWVYYEYSMEQNVLAKSDLGIGLCYIHFGNLFKIKEEYNLARQEYIKAYELMENISDRWHWLEACLSIAEISLLTEDFDSFLKYINLAENTSKEINSIEHIAEIYNLKHKYHVKKKNYDLALEDYQRGVEIKDSLYGIQKNNLFFDLRLNFEKERHNQAISEMELINREKNAKRQATLYVLLILSLSGIIVTATLWHGYRQKSKANRMLHDLEKMRTDFFTGITHEFRTPLTIITGLSEHIEQHNENVRKEAKSIKYQGQILLDMVNKLLDMAKIKSRVEKVNWVNADLNAYITMIVESYRSYASAKGIDLVFESHTRTTLVDFIPEYVEKIIGNILSNSFKHTPRGGRIILKLEEKNEEIVLTIQDTGTGIAEEDLAHIFEEFYQGEIKVENEIGSGIGLTLVSKMVEIMKGKIRATNNPEGGAKFILTLPKKQRFLVNSSLDFNVELTEPKLLDISDNEEVQEDRFSEKDRPTLLIVDDNSDIQLYVGSLFEDNYNVRYASNGKEGIEKAKEFIPDLIISDLIMPIMNGMELSKIIREHELINHIPIVMITAKTGDNLKQEAYTTGIDALLYKPFNSKELIIRVNNLLEQRKQLRNKYSKSIIEGNLESDEILPADREFLERLNVFIYEYITDPRLGVDLMANKLFISKSQLNRKIKQLTGYTTAAYVMQIRLEKSKRLLKTNEDPIAEVAMACGFEDPNYFSRVFKQIYKQTPSQYRKML